MQNTSFGAHGRRKQQFLKGIYWKIEVLELSAGGGGRAATKNSNFKKEFIEKNMVAEFASGSGMYPVIQHTAPDTATALQCMPPSSINAFRGCFFEALLQSINVKISLGPKSPENVNQPRGTLQQQTHRSMAQARSAGCADSIPCTACAEPKWLKRGAVMTFITFWICLPLKRPPKISKAWFCESPHAIGFK